MEYNGNLFDVDSFNAIPGKGIEGFINDEKIQIGNIKLLGKISEKEEKVIRDLSEKGKTTVIVKYRNEVVGVLGISDTVKKTSKKAIELLKERGIKTYLITGDNERTAKAIAKELNYIYIDSGAMYRAVTLYCIRKGYLVGGEPRTERIIEDLAEIHISFIYNSDIGSYETFLNSENVEREIRSIEVS